VIGDRNLGYPATILRDLLLRAEQFAFAKLKPPNHFLQMQIASKRTWKVQFHASSQDESIRFCKTKAAKSFFANANCEQKNLEGSIPRLKPGRVNSLLQN
jgi:hypothetical protein